MPNNNTSNDPRPNKRARGITRLVKALLYSRDGLRQTFRSEEAFRQEVVLAVVLVPLALFLPVSNIGKSMMIGAVFLVLIVELLNTAIETTVDHVSLEVHPLAKHAKDIGSAAVLLSLVNAVIVWLLVLMG